MRHAADYDATIRSMRAQGYKSHEIAEAIGICKRSVQNYCQQNGITVPEELKAQVINGRMSEKRVAEKIKEVSNGNLEYIRGYVRKEDPIVVRCLTCEAEYERTYHNIVHMGKTKCPYCEKQKRADLETAKQIKKQAAEASKAEMRKRKAVALFVHKLSRLHECPVCGTKVYKYKYCSDMCKHKAYNKQHKVSRRVKVKSAMVDKDITLESLYKRDKGICYLCKGKCDYEDYVVRNGAFITGDWYPSIDHIKPLSRGGKHSWDNVALAHFRCNTLKRDNELSPSGVKFF